jgi:hypothetical protein
MYMPLLAMSRSTPEPIYWPLDDPANTAVYPDHRAECQQSRGSERSQPARRVVSEHDANFFCVDIVGIESTISPSNRTYLRIEMNTWKWLLARCSVSALIIAMPGVAHAQSIGERSGRTEGKDCQSRHRRIAQHLSTTSPATSISDADYRLCLA